MNVYDEYKKTVAYLESFVRIERAHEYMSHRVDPSVYLKRLHDFLARIGDPHKQFSYIHVSGTAGKGSVSNMIHRSLVLSGKKVGLVTSPFVTTTIEKIQVGDKYISPAEFVEIVTELKPYIDEAYANGTWGGPSYFEILCAVSLVYFARQKCEWVVLEVGCGGRYDYTNVTGPGTISCITNIGDDHAHLIGPTLADIAYEKAGIIKPGGLFFTTEKRRELRDVFRKECEMVDAGYFEVSAGADYRQANENLVYAVGRAAGCDDGVIGQAVQTTALPCRFEALQTRPRVILDGAHNIIKMKSTMLNMSHLSPRPKKIRIIFGAGSTKDSLGMLRACTKIADEIYITHGTSIAHKSADIQKLYTYAQKQKVTTHLFTDAHQALDEAIKKSKNDDVILVTGSLYLAGELRTRWISEKDVLRYRKSMIE